MNITVHFYSYFKDLVKGDELSVTLPDGSCVSDLLAALFARHPQLKALEKSMLVAVGMEYQPRNHELKEHDEVSLFPPVQGG